jgi:hypothetical protein
MWRLLIPQILSIGSYRQSYSKLNNPAKRTRMETAGIVALVYVGGMAVVGIGGCLHVTYIDPPKHTGQMGDPFNCFFTYMSVIAVAVFWPIVLPLGVIGSICDNLQRCKNKSNDNDNNNT